MQNPDTGVLIPSYPDTSTLLVGCTRQEFSASAIARAVEDCEAHVLNMNVTSIEHEDEQVVVWLRVNRLNPESVVRSLERYGYHVLDTHTTAPHNSEAMQARIQQIIKLIEM